MFKVQHQTNPIIPLDFPKIVYFALSLTQPSLVLLTAFESKKNQATGRCFQISVWQGIRLFLCFVAAVFRKRSRKTRVYSISFCENLGADFFGVFERLVNGEIECKRGGMIFV
jgi:hypothetical protein